MSYRDNVQAICDAVGIPNPIRESDLAVKGVSFQIEGFWHYIPATDMNRAGRLFFQYLIPKDAWPGGKWKRPTLGWSAIHWGEQKLGRAKSHFAELWDDAEEQNRSMIIAAKKAILVTVHWKE